MRSLLLLDGFPLCALYSIHFMWTVEPSTSKGNLSSHFLVETNGGLTNCKKKGLARTCQGTSTLARTSSCTTRVAQCILARKLVVPIPWPYTVGPMIPWPCYYVGAWPMISWPGQQSYGDLNTPPYSGRSTPWRKTLNLRIQKDSVKSKLDLIRFEIRWIRFTTSFIPLKIGGITLLVPIRV